MTKKDVQVNFRMPEELKSELEKAAVANGRSLTAEIVKRLTGSFILDGRGSETPADDYVRRLIGKTIDVLLSEGWKAPDDYDNGDHHTIKADK